MTDRVELIMRLFRSYQQSDPVGMLECYHDQATFQDIAFQLKNKQEIGAMLCYT